MEQSPELLPIFLAGPTASGKSAIALELAEMCGGEIISVDSMQVYRGLDIGTAKPSPAERARIPHHLIDVVNLDQGFDAAQFLILAKTAMAEIQARGRVPIFCGGTGLYFKAFTEGLGQAPPSNPQLRATLEQIPRDQLLTELEQRDPATFEKIDRKNLRRVIRALEVIRLTGRPFSEQRADWKAIRAMLPGCYIGLNRAAGDLWQRIDLRTEAMFAQGLMQETAALREHGLERNPTALQALGYRQAVEHLQGQRSLSETINLVKIRTRQLAKRQLTWFRRQLRLHWLAVQDKTPRQMAETILQCRSNPAATP